RHDRKRGADRELHVDRFRYAQKAEHLEQHRHHDGPATDPEQPRQKARDDAADNDRGCKPKEFADRHTKNHQPAHAATVATTCGAACPLSTSASASQNVSAPAEAFTPSVARCRRNARAPGTPRNRPSTWRVIACSRTPRASSRSM